MSNPEGTTATGIGRAAADRPVTQPIAAGVTCRTGSESTVGGGAVGGSPLIASVR
ncbi:hypothetical protein [Actinokineospora sp. NPDC004072]